MQSTLSTAHTEPITIQPYTFPDTISNPAVIPAIGPELNSPTHRLPETRFSSDDLERLVWLVAEEEPWTKPHGERTNAWNRVLNQLQSERSGFEGTPITTLQNKVNALVAWQAVSQTTNHEIPVDWHIFSGSELSVWQGHQLKHDSNIDDGDRRAVREDLCFEGSCG